MARYPDASYRPLGDEDDEPRLVKKRKIVCHTMVGSLWGTDSYFRQGGYSGVESHFGVGGDGETLQWQDTSRQADAQLEGNDDCISIETADHGPEFRAWSGSDVPAWTDAQIEAIAQIIAWACDTHGIPCVLIDDTRDSTRGIGYHRQGIDPYRDQGERYSTSFGKVCPGDRRVAQMPRVIARANEIILGDDMVGKIEAPNGEDWQPEHAGSWMMSRLREIRWGKIVSTPNGTKWTISHALSWIMRRLREFRSQISEILDVGRANGAKLDALMDAQTGLDTNAIKAHIDERYQAAAAERAELAEALDTATDTLDSLTELVEQGAAGEITPDEMVEAFKRVLREGVTEDDAD